MNNMALYIIIALVVVVLIAVAVIFSRKKKGSAAESVNEQIYIGNLPYRTSENDLRRIFKRFGEIRSVRVIRDQNTGRSRGFAFLTFETCKQAEDSLAAHGEDMYGRQMVVRIAKVKSE